MFHAITMSSNDVLNDLALNAVGASKLSHISGNVQYTRIDGVSGAPLLNHPMTARSVRLQMPLTSRIGTTSADCGFLTSRASESIINPPQKVSIPLQHPLGHAPIVPPLSLNSIMPTISFAPIASSRQLISSAAPLNPPQGSTIHVLSTFDQCSPPSYIPPRQPSSGRLSSVALLDEEGGPQCYSPSPPRTIQLQKNLQNNSYSQSCFASSSSNSGRRTIPIGNSQWQRESQQLIHNNHQKLILSSSMSQGDEPLNSTDCNVNLTNECSSTHPPPCSPQHELPMRPRIRPSLGSHADDSQLQIGTARGESQQRTGSLLAKFDSFLDEWNVNKAHRAGSPSAPVAVKCLSLAHLNSQEACFVDTEIDSSCINNKVHHPLANRISFHRSGNHGIANAAVQHSSPPPMTPQTARLSVARGKMRGSLMHANHVLASDTSLNLIESSLYNSRDNNETSANLAVKVKPTLSSSSSQHKEQNCHSNANNNYNHTKNSISSPVVFADSPFDLNDRIINFAGNQISDNKNKPTTNDDYPPSSSISSSQHQNQTQISPNQNSISTINENSDNNQTTTTSFHVPLSAQTSIIPKFKNLSHNNNTNNMNENYSSRHTASPVSFRLNGSSSGVASSSVHMAQGGLSNGGKLASQVIRASRMSMQTASTSYSQNFSNAANSYGGNNLGSFTSRGTSRPPSSSAVAIGTRGVRSSTATSSSSSRHVTSVSNGRGLQSGVIAYERKKQEIQTCIAETREKEKQKLKAHEKELLNKVKNVRSKIDRSQLPFATTTGGEIETVEVLASSTSFNNNSNSPECISSSSLPNFTSETSSASVSNPPVNEEKNSLTGIKKDHTQEQRQNVTTTLRQSQNTAQSNIKAPKSSRRPVSRSTATAPVEIFIPKKSPPKFQKPQQQQPSVSSFDVATNGKTKHASNLNNDNNLTIDEENDKKTPIADVNAYALTKENNIEEHNSSLNKINSPLLNKDDIKIQQESEVEKTTKMCVSLGSENEDGKNSIIATDGKNFNMDTKLNNLASKQRHAYDGNTHVEDDDNLNSPRMDALDAARLIEQFVHQTDGEEDDFNEEYKFNTRHDRLEDQDQASDQSPHITNNYEEYIQRNIIEKSVQQNTIQYQQHSHDVPMKNRPAMPIEASSPFVRNSQIQLNNSLSNLENITGEASNCHALNKGKNFITDNLAVVDYEDEEDHLMEKVLEDEIKRLYATLNQVRARRQQRRDIKALLGPSSPLRASVNSNSSVNSGPAPMSSSMSLVISSLNGGACAPQSSSAKVLIRSSAQQLNFSNPGNTFGKTHPNKVILKSSASANNNGEKGTGPSANGLVQPHHGLVSTKLRRRTIDLPSNVCTESSAISNSIDSPC